MNKKNIVDSFFNQTSSLKDWARARRPSGECRKQTTQVADCEHPATANTDQLRAPSDREHLATAKIRVMRVTHHEV